MTSGTYLASVQLSDREVPADSIDFRRGATNGPLIITLKSSPAEIAGIVQDRDGNRAPGALITLVPDAQPSPERLYRRFWADQNGQFRLKDLAPGKYHVYAWEDLEDRAEFNSSVLELHREQGAGIELSDNARRTVALTLIPRER